MVKILIKWVVLALALLAIGRYVPGIAVANTYTAFIVAFLWGAVLLFIKPILSILTFPINLLTLGLFSFVVNALLFWFISSFVAGFSVAGFMPALVGSIILSLVSWLLHELW
ncbi:MAG TPA: phage holin family protein [Candidatus Paceibacterota bacterium]